MSLPSIGRPLSTSSSPSTWPGRTKPSFTENCLTRYSQSRPRPPPAQSRPKPSSAKSPTQTPLRLMHLPSEGVKWKPPSSSGTTASLAPEASKSCSSPRGRPRRRCPAAGRQTLIRRRLRLSLVPRRDLSRGAAAVRRLGDAVRGGTGRLIATVFATAMASWRI